MTVRARATRRDPVRRSPIGPETTPEAPLRTHTLVDGAYRRGRGAVSNPHARFEPIARERYDDGWDLENDQVPLATEVTLERARTILTRNASPDIGFDQSINPYRGLRAWLRLLLRPATHAFQGLSPGLDFETKLFAKPNAVDCCRRS
jgi:hypothetical protein